MSPYGTQILVQWHCVIDLSRIYMCISGWQYGRFLFIYADIHVLMHIVLLFSSSERNIKYSMLCKCKTENSQLAFQPVHAEVWPCGEGPFLTQSWLLSELLFLPEYIKCSVYLLTSNSIRIKDLSAIFLEGVMKGSFLT